MSKQPADRQASALELQTELDAFLVEIGQVCNANTIAEYLRGLFPDLIEAQERLAVEGASNVEELLTGVSIARPSLDDLAATEASESDLEVRELTVSAPHRPPRWWRDLPPVRWALTTAAVVAALVAMIVLLRGGAPPTDATEGDAVARVEPVAKTANDVPQDERATLSEETARAPATLPQPAPPIAREAPEPDRVSARPAKKRRRASHKRRRPRRRLRAPASSADRQQAEAEPAPLRFGHLNVNSEPWSEVWLGKRRLGTTPLAYIKLPVGRHRLTLRNSARSLEKSVWVEIDAGLTEGINIRLDKP